MLRKLCSEFYKGLSSEGRSWHATFDCAGDAKKISKSEVYEDEYIY